MSGGRNDLRRSQRAEKVGIVGISPSEIRTTTTEIEQDADSDGRLYDGATIPRRQLHSNYRHPNHYRVWRQSYGPYLRQLYETFANAIMTPDNVEKLSRVSFNDFAEFVYVHSSGYISDYL